MYHKHWAQKQRTNPRKIAALLSKQKAGLKQQMSDDKLDQLATKVGNFADTNGGISQDGFSETTLAIFGKTLKDLLASADFAVMEDQISNTLLVLKIAGERWAEEALLSTRLRVIHLLRRAAGNDFPIMSGADIREILAAPIVMPSTYVLFSDTVTAASEDTQAKKTRRAVAKARADDKKLVELFSSALDELATATSADHQLTPPAVGLPFTYMALTAAFTATKPGIRQTAQRLIISLSTTSASDLAEKVLRGLRQASERLAASMPVGGRLTRIGSQWMAPEELGFVESETTADKQTDHMSATRPVGIADLLVVKQKLKKYELGEIAHVENCLVGELRRRTHERTDLQETESLQEIETSKEEERDLQTTDKVELKQEAEHIVKADNSVQAGMSLSASYGAVTLNTNLSSSSSNAQQDARRQANTYSKEVVSRAVSRTMERTLARRKERQLFQVVETNLHEFLAKDKDATGVYRWVNKVYEVQVYNYGRRMLYEIVVPEPAAFFKQSVSGAKAEGATMAKPVAIDFPPSALNESNWTDYAARYRLGAATPPPKMYVTVVKGFSKATNGPNDPRSDDAVLDIPDGYEAFGARVRATGSFWPGHAPTVDIVVGTDLRRFTTQTDEFFVYLNSQISKVGVSYSILNIAAFTATIEITCMRTDAALHQWQTKFFGELVTAYNLLLSKFEGELDRQRQQEEAQPYGRNPLADERIVRGELRKSALTLIRRDNFTGFDAVKQDQISDGPYADFSKADRVARSILFFEQAFEWEQMTYRFYEYFWGRKQQWKKDLLLDDKNEEFRSFLTAGSARLILPVRPGFEKLVAHYFETGNIANSDNIPDVTSAEYLPILTEIKEELAAPGEEKEYGESWQVTVPTSLVILKSGASQLAL
jgi:hypothetical protein